MSSPSAICPGCGLETAENNGPVHAYVITSPGCWRLFGQAQTLPVERLFVDAYMAQHPGGTGTQQRQSAAVHLIVLDAVLRHDQPSEKASDIARAAVDLGRTSRGFPELEAPTSWSHTVADVIERPATSSVYIRAVFEAWLHREPPELKRWTRSVLELLYGPT